MSWADRHPHNIAWPIWDINSLNLLRGGGGQVVGMILVIISPANILSKIFGKRNSTKKNGKAYFLTFQSRNPHAAGS